MSLSLIKFNILLEILDNAMKQENNKNHKDYKGKNKTLFLEYMLMSMQNSHTIYKATIRFNKLILQCHRIQSQYTKLFVSLQSYQTFRQEVRDKQEKRPG